MTSIINAEQTRAKAPKFHPRGGPVAPTKSRLTPLNATEIKLTGGYWLAWQQRNAEVILGHCQDWMERIGWLKNFDLAASAKLGWTHHGIEFVDSEVYKLLEAMAWELGHGNDADLAPRYDALVARVAAAQDSDGYLHTSFGRPWQPARYSNLEWGHELYCFGHLIQAAVARIRTAGGGELVDVAIRLADHLYETFGPGGREAICGHPEIEPALAEFGRALNEPKYIELARLFIDRRGHGLLGDIEYGPEYFQDDHPVRQATTLRGHAVRALYLAAGALDVAVETGDEDLAAAVEQQWANTVASKTYITGGMGSHHQDESFGDEFELPSDRAYSETCAGIGSNMLSWRLLLNNGDGRHADLIERTLLNNILASPREDGRAFFYTNTLHQRVPGAIPSEVDINAKAQASLRAPWFEVSCCPTNVARTLASVELYFSTKTSTGLQLHQYGEYDIDAVLSSGERMAISVRSDYPYNGTVTITWNAPTTASSTLGLRIPGWAETAILQIGAGEPQNVTGPAATIVGAFNPGDTATLTLPMHAKWIQPDPRIDAIRGTVAVERGPLVLSLELPQEEGSVNELLVMTQQPLITTPHGASATFSKLQPTPTAWPYGVHVEPESSTTTRRLIPYAQWANNGPSTMRVWLPTA